MAKNLVPLKRLIISFLLLFLLVGCEGQKAKEFLFSRPDVSFQVNSTGYVYDKYTPIETLKNISCRGEIVTFDIDGNKEEILITGSYQLVPGTNYEIKSG